MMWGVLAFTITLLIGIFSIPFLGRDNVVEEVCEDMIKAATGIELDLTPTAIVQEPDAVEEEAEEQEEDTISADLMPFLKVELPSEDSTE